MNYLMRLLVGVVSIGMIVAIIFAVSQFNTVETLQTDIGDMEIVGTELAVDLAAAEVTAEAMAREFAASSTQSAQDLADLNATATQLVNEAESLGTESADIIGNINATATQLSVELEELNLSATEAALQAQQTQQNLIETLADVEATSQANADALEPFQTQAQVLAETATVQSGFVSEAEIALTENASLIGTQSAELTAAQAALDVIATSVSQINSPRVAVTPEMTEEAEATEEMVEPEMTEEAEATEEMIEPEMTEEAEATEEMVEPEMTEEAEVTEEMVEPEMTEEAEATEEMVEPEMTEEAEATEEMLEPEMTADPEATEAVPMELPNLMRFEGQDFEMLVPETFLSFDLRRDQETAVETFSELGENFLPALGVATQPNATIFIGVSDMMGEDGALAPILIQSVIAVDFESMDAYMSGLGIPEDQIISSTVIEEDDAEIGRVYVADAANQASVGLIYLHEIEGTIYFVFITGADTQFDDDKIGLYDEIGFSFAVD